MKIQLRGIIQFHRDGKMYVDLVIKKKTAVNAVKVRMGVDIKLNRGKILTFLAEQYDALPGEIDWPEYITIDGKEIIRSLPL